MAGCNDDSLNLKKDYSKYIGYKQNGKDGFSWTKDRQVTTDETE